MYAIILDDFGGPEKMRWALAPTPEPEEGQVRIKVRAAGLNRADLLQRQGYYPPPPGESTTMGLEVSGIIDAIGPNVDGWQRGDEVVALLAGGGYAEYVVVPAGQVIRPPANVDLVSAAGLMEVAATVVSNMDHVHLSAGESILIHGGAGGIGSFAIQYAKALGCRVLATCSAGKMDYVRSLGADEVIDYRSDWVEQVRSSTSGVDVILDIIGAKYLSDNVKALGYDGRIVIIGMQKGTKGELNIAALLNKRGTITATSLRGRDHADKARITQRVAKIVWPMIEQGTIQLAKEQRFDIREVSQAHELMASGDLVGKIILTIPEA